MPPVNRSSRVKSERFWSERTSRRRRRHTRGLQYPYPCEKRVPEPQSYAPGSTSATARLAAAAAAPCWKRSSDTAKNRSRAGPVRLFTAAAYRAPTVLRGGLRRNRGALGARRASISAGTAARTVARPIRGRRDETDRPRPSAVRCCIGAWFPTRRAGGRRRGALLPKSIQGRMITALRRAFPQGFELYRPQVSSTHP